MINSTQLAKVREAIATVDSPLARRRVTELVYSFDKRTALHWTACVTSLVDTVLVEFQHETLYTAWYINPNGTMFRV